MILAVDVPCPSKSLTECQMEDARVATCTFCAAPKLLLMLSCRRAEPDAHVSTRAKGHREKLVRWNLRK